MDDNRFDNQIEDGTDERTDDILDSIPAALEAALENVLETLSGEDAQDCGQWENPTDEPFSEKAQEEVEEPEEKEEFSCQEEEKEEKNKKSEERHAEKRTDEEKAHREAKEASDTQTHSQDPVFRALPLPEPAYDFKNDISVFAFSQPGQSHLRSGQPCQDRCAFRIVGESLVLAAAADGVGSCALADYGAEEAVQASLDFLECQLKPLISQPDFSLDSKLMGKMLREMMQYAYERVEKRAEQLEQLVYTMQSTLTAAVYDGTTLYFAHAGDDGIVALDQSGRYAMVTSRHKAAEANSVFPLQSKATWQFGKVDRTAAFVLVTDGVLDAFVRSESENNRVYYPFVEPIFSSTASNAEDVKSLCADWFEYMQSDSYRSVVTDDLTLLAVINHSAKKNAAAPVFSIEEWKEKSKEYEARRMAALYPPHPSDPRSKTVRKEKASDCARRARTKAKSLKSSSGADPHFARSDQTESGKQLKKALRNGTSQFRDAAKIGSAMAISWLGEGLSQLGGQMSRRSEQTMRKRQQDKKQAKHDK